MTRLKTVRRILVPIFAAFFLSQTAQASDVLQAAQSGDTEALAAALSADTATEPGVLGRALFFAARSGHTEAVKILLDHGADANTSLSFGTPLQKAARANHAEIVGLLLAAGADPNAKSEDTGQTALHDAAERGSLDAAKLLLEHGADVNARESWGLPPIYLATVKKRDEMLKLLAENGAGPLPTEPISPEELAAADRELGRVTGVRCTQCHELVAGVFPSGAHNHGPSLIGIFERPKGGVEGFAYSEVMAAQSGNWTLEELNEFIADPPGSLPGTTMALTFDLTREEHVALIAYLSEL